MRTKCDAPSSRAAKGRAAAEFGKLGVGTKTFEQRRHFLLRLRRARRREHQVIFD